MELEIKGHSGCRLEILRQNNELHMVKATYDPEYAQRLYRQAVKQKNASSTEYPHIRIPKILDIELDAGSCTVKMEYVYSKNYIEFFDNAGFEQISYFIKALKIFIDDEIRKSPVQRVGQDLITEKFRSVKEQIGRNTSLRADGEIPGLIARSERFFSTLPEYIEIPVGTCHGDLTFSNILFNGNNYYLIDFLDSFIESPLMDMVKIRQDSRHLWSVLMYNGGTVDKIRLNIISRKIDGELDRYFSTFGWYNDHYRMFQVMNFVRILQYAHEKPVVEYLKTELASLLK